MRIQQSMRRCSLHSMLLLNLILPIDVTFSTATTFNLNPAVFASSIRRLIARGNNVF